jgi:predicted permease
MREEMAHHIELRTAELMKQGSSRKEASRVAHMEFGHVETHRDTARKSRGLGFMDEIRFSWLDFKLAFRMLIRYPGLTVMSVLAMTAGIAFGAGFLEFTSQWARPDLSFDPDHRMVGIVVDDTESLGVEARLLHDFAAWREELRSYEDLGVMRLVNRNLDMGGEGSEADAGRPLSVTQISASAFRMTGAPALMGRTLIAEDEQADAPGVVLLGHDLWQDRFGGDPEVVGRTVRLGEEAATVVGVMPEGYGFPRSQSLWVPFRLRPVDVQLGESPAVYVFGRLAPGASMEQAQAELDTRDLLIADARPGGGERLSARVVPYPELVYMPVPGFFDPAFVYVNLFILALVLLFCANVALLLFARAASRESELVVRNALGAGRYRIIVQLFSEALVLGGIAAVLGLLGARNGYEWFLTVVQEDEGSSFMPFWFEPRISTLTAVYAVCLTILGAGVAGVLPALKVTRGLASRLRSQSAGGGGLGFGGVWTVIIVSQIAVTVPLPAFTYIAVSEMVTLDTPDVAFAPDEYLTARIAVERDRESVPFDLDTRELFPDRDGTDDAAFAGRYARMLDELDQRLSAEVAVTGVAYASRTPLTYHPWHQVELDVPMAEPPDGEDMHQVGRADVEPQFLETMGGEVLAGRALDSEDVVSRAHVVVVDRRFADRVLGGRNPVGVHLRYTAIDRRPPPGPDAPWYEIVGMVENLGISNASGGVYHAAARGSLYPANILVHLRADPGEFAPRLRAIAADMGAAVRVEELRPLDDAPGDEAGIYAWGATAIISLTFTALMLSLAGIYSVMAFTVSRRTREIGIRVALGADRRRLVAAIFRRPLTQVVVGVAAGAVLLVQSAEYLFVVPGLTPQQYGLVALHSVLMFGVCMLACVVPTRRALAVEPVEALNVEG